MRRIVQPIADITGQIKLLALNTTIGSARSEESRARRPRFCAEV
jgi:methyl-accepting chemotaxis protein